MRRRGPSRRPPGRPGQGTEQAGSGAGGGGRRPLPARGPGPPCAAGRRGVSSKGHGRSRLKGLDLQGYKTFASKSMFEFAPTITAIVGPNGSGKSNIADAIRWVLGEQSYSLLRGKRTDDMIFSGSEQRARASMAAATITFDNSDGWLPIDFSEVTVGRRAYRDGENEYLINGQRVRLD